MKVAHVGGTGVGGGTFLGLSKTLLGITDIEELKKLFQAGNTQKVDVTVKDIVGSSIGKIPENATASNLAKLRTEIIFEKADLAAGIANMVGQTIALIACFAARAEDCPLILFTGKLTKIEKIMSVIKDVADIYGVTLCLPKNREFVSVLGAGFFAEA